MNWKRLRIEPQRTLLDALAVIDKGTCQIALVTTPQDHLLGVLSDGDIRRALLQGKSLQTSVAEVMHSTPVTVHQSEGRGVALLHMRQKQLRHIPVLDNEGRVCDLWFQEQLLNFQGQPNSVVIMAGGLGSRLSPLTDDIPKPMLPVGGQPLLELTLEHLRCQGFRQFYIAVNYNPQCIINYFGDGSRMGISISYVHEEKRLGTAGALSLLPPQDLPCIVINGDILTRLNLTNALATHEMRQSPATMVVKMYTVQIPYGVVHYDTQGYIQSIEEKPNHCLPISAGIYILSPEALSLVPKDTFFDMPDLFRDLVTAGLRPAVHEMVEYWLDIGRVSDYRRANEECNIFHQVGIL